MGWDICANLEEGIMRNISMKLFLIWSVVQEEMLFKYSSNLSSGGHIF